VPHDVTRLSVPDLSFDARWFAAPIMRRYREQYSEFSETIKKERVRGSDSRRLWTAFIELFVNHRKNDFFQE